ncbi:MAG: hypothetical protein AB7D07_08430 [Desulfovibrionaceae bacterium]
MRLRKSRSFASGFFALACLLGMVAGICACSQLNVGHLERAPWAINVDQELSMQFWTFHYRIVPMRDQFGVKGQASIIKDAIPRKMVYIEDMWLACYLSDEDGRVLAKDIHVFAPRSAQEGERLSFDFILRPEHIEAGPLFISFGYRMVMTSAPDPEEMPFFASEGALSH